MILGVDPGSRLAGYAFLAARRAGAVTPRDFTLIGAGVLRADPSASLAERIAALHEALYGLVMQHRPQVLVLERAFYDKNVATAIKLGEIRGAFIAAAGRAGVPIDEMTPARVKRLIVGNGQATKEQVSLAVRALTGFDRQNLPHDVTDAMAIALSYGMTRLGVYADSLGRTLA